MEGWIKIGRELTDDEMYHGERFDKTHAWIDLLMMANTQKRTLVKRGIRVTIQPGDVVISSRDLAERWMWSRNTVFSFLQELELSRRITIRKSNVINVITVINWAEYSLCEPQDEPQNGNKPQNEPQDEPQNEPQNTERMCTDKQTGTHNANMSTEPQDEPQNEPQDEPQISAQSIPLYKNIPSYRNYSTISKGSSTKHGKSKRKTSPPSSKEECVDDKKKIKSKRDAFANDLELSANEGYKNFGRWLLDNAPNVMDGKCSGIKPPTEAEYLKLRVHLTGRELAGYVLQIENNRLYLSKYKSMYLTVMNWLKMDGRLKPKINEQRRIN